jgi:polyhydroxyalkanoate synthesis regulator phasin
VLDVIKQAVYTSVGFASMTGEKMTEAIRNLRRSAELTEKELKEFADEVTLRSGEAKSTSNNRLTSKLTMYSTWFDQVGNSPDSGRSQRVTPKIDRRSH